MAKPHTIILNDDVVRASIKMAWTDSEPGNATAHEEGGFILRDSAGVLRASRWPKGLQNEIRVPLHSDCKFGGDEIVASFHTHPNTGSNYLQEPSETDKRAVRNDPNLKSAITLASSSSRGIQFTWLPQPAKSANWAIPTIYLPNNRSDLWPQF